MTVFVNRTMGFNASYPHLDLHEVPPSWRTAGYPRPVKVRANVLPIPGVPELYIIEDDGDPDTNLTPAEYVREGAILVDAVSGQILRVLERDELRVKLADLVNISKFSGWLWVIPPSVQAITDEEGSPNPPAVTGRYPCVGVYQRVLVQ